jgi:chromosome segregation ATPase
MTKSHASRNPYEAMTTTQITKEIRSLEDRREHLTAEIEQAHAELTTAQGALIRGEAKASEKATQAQARFSALDGAAAALAERLDSLRADLESAQATEKRRNDLQTLVTLTKDAAGHRTEYESAFRELSEAMERCTARMQGSRAEWESTHKSFTRLFAEHAPGLLTLRAERRNVSTQDYDRMIEERDALIQEIEAEGVTVADVINDLLTRPQFVTTLPAYRHPKTPFREAIDLAAKIHNNHEPIEA